MPDDAPSSEKPAPPPREGPDRRSHPTPMLTRFLFVGRRRAGRRDGESERIYVDHPGRAVIVAFILLTLFSSADAWFTLRELAAGATEANPIMRAALELGNGPFVIIKTIVTLLGGAFLALHKNWALGRRCLLFAVAGYVVLTVYHLYGVMYVLPAGS